MSGVRGEINGWRCQAGSPQRHEAAACGRTTYVIHIDDGVTPMFLACRAEGHEPTDPLSPCEGTATSLMYPDGTPGAHVLAAVKWEWYMPDAAELKRMRKRARREQKRYGPGDQTAALDHVEMGGLLLRKLTDEGRAVLAAVYGFAP